MQNIKDTCNRIPYIAGLYGRLYYPTYYEVLIDDESIWKYPCVHYTGNPLDDSGHPQYTLISVENLKVRFKLLKEKNSITTYRVDFRELKVTDRKELGFIPKTPLGEDYPLETLEKIYKSVL